MLFPKPQPEEAIPRFRFSPNPNRAREIHWREWTPEAFGEAKSEEKPILLSIAAVWCHWCHVMDETSYSDGGVIHLLNEKYIPVRVDADKRPDIQSRYLLGGWPTTAVLTGRGEVISGGTYIPPNQFRALLEKASDFYQENREMLEDESLRKRDQIIEFQSKPAPTRYEIDRSLVDDVVKSLNNSLDSKFGGFGLAPKFPNPPAIELLLRRAFLENEPYMLEMVTDTLSHMADGEIFDKVWGGFFRYSTERDWGKPHYEKLLGENAEFIINYLQAYQVSEFLRYREVAEKTLGFVDTFLADKKHGGFFGSQDSDETFYTLNAEERTKVRIPYIDPIIYTDTNALMISAYIEAHKVLGNADYLDFAKKTIAFLLSNCYSPDKGMVHYFDGKPHFSGWLADQVYIIRALIDTYGVTGDRSYIDAAETLIDICEKYFQTENGPFLDRSSNSDEPELAALFIKNTPVRENALLARNLYRLAYINNNDRYEEAAERILANIELGPVESTPSFSLFGLAIDEVLTEPVVLITVATKEEVGTHALLKEVWRNYLPGKEVKLLDPIADYEAIEKSGFPPERHPAMYPCIGRVCLPAVETPHEFKAILEDLPGRSKQS